MAPTDKSWFDFLKERARLGLADEVNFWMPKPWGGTFGALSTGQPLLFKLKSPWNAVAGVGFFSHYTEIPISLAWDAFRENNGAPSLEAVRVNIGRLRRETPPPWADYVIGCILLAEPTFWDEEDWIPGPPGWKPQIVRGSGYDLTTEPGRGLWAQVVERLAARGVARDSGAPVEFGGYGDPALTPRRVGQGTFTAIVRDAYGRSCAISRERALPALEAAHIKPLSEARTHSIRNGMLLRSDVHKLFDVGYLTVTPDLRVEASHAMKEDFNDGKNYLALHGTKILVPEKPDLRPDPESLRWHNENRYRG